MQGISRFRRGATAVAQGVSVFRTRVTMSTKGETSEKVKVGPLTGPVRGSSKGPVMGMDAEDVTCVQIRLCAASSIFRCSSLSLLTDSHFLAAHGKEVLSGGEGEG